jgi:hypothetical protein
MIPMPQEQQIGKNSKKKIFGITAVSENKLPYEIKSQKF